MSATVSLGVPVLGLVVVQTMCLSHGLDAVRFYQREGLDVSATAVVS